VHPAVGEARNYRGQLYKCVDAFPHVTRDGRQTALLVISTRCADCYRRFEITETHTHFRRRRLLRRCEDCRKPGVPIGSVRRRRQKSVALSPLQEQMYRVLVELAMAQRSRVLPGARGWVRTQDWKRALVERGVLRDADMCGKGSYYRERRGMILRKRIEIYGPAVRAT
jgi:hypothetical protein